MSTVRVDKRSDHVTVVTLDRPEVLNAMSVELCDDLLAALDAVARDNRCRVVVLTGAGRGFCSGLDLDDHGVLPNIDGLTVPRLGPLAMRHYSRLTPAMRRVPQPIIAAINGPAYGGGMCLALAADIRIAGASALFNATGLVNGLTSTELGASWLLPRLIGASHANDILLTGRVVDAPEALRLGLVSRVVPDERLLDEALETAESMSRFSIYGLQMTKRALWANLEVSSLDTAIEFEDRNQLMLGYTDNLPEAIRARNEGRAPVYTDVPRDLSMPETTDRQG
ncbi:MAG: enoyl-CoA hydratase-related protein [Actinomycetota bacterium]